MKALRIGFLLAAITALGHIAHGTVWSPSDSDFRRPLTKCWQGSQRGNDLRIIASDNESVFILTSPDNVVERWNFVAGAKDWELPLPGAPIHFEPLEDGRIIVFANGLSGGVIQAIATGTGLALWQRNLPSAFVPEAFISSAVNNSVQPKGDRDEIAFVAEDGILRRLDPATGIVSEFRGRLDARAKRLVGLGDSLLFPRDGRWEILSFDSEERPVFGSYQGEILSLTALTDTRFAAGDSKGGISLYRIGKGDPLWYVKTGGAVTQLLRDGDSVVAASRDNYLYAFNLLFGTLQWKKRFDGRLLPISVSNHYAAVAALDSRSVDIVDLRSGKKINGIVRETIANGNKPFSLSGRFLSVVTDRSLQVFSPKCTVQNEKADR